MAKRGAWKSLWWEGWLSSTCSHPSPSLHSPLVRAALQTGFLKSKATRFIRHAWLPSQKSLQTLERNSWGWGHRNMTNTELRNPGSLWQHNCIVIANSAVINKNAPVSPSRDPSCFSQWLLHQTKDPPPSGRQLPGAGDTVPKSPFPPSSTLIQSAVEGWLLSYKYIFIKNQNNIPFLTSLKGATKRNKPIILIRFYQWKKKPLQHQLISWKNNLPIQTSMSLGHWLTGPLQKWEMLRRNYCLTS